MFEILLTVTFGTASFLLLILLFSRRRREGEPPLIKGWIPYVGKTLEYRKDSYKFLKQLQKCHGDVFTVLIAGKYMTFVMNPLLYPAVIKHGKQLDFHEFSHAAAAKIFGYPYLHPIRFPGLSDKIQRSFLLLQGSTLNSLALKMMGNLELVFQQDFQSSHVVQGECDWQQEGLYEFCEHVMFKATFLTLYGQPPNTSVYTHLHGESWIDELRDNFRKFDSMFPLLIAKIPIGLLGRTRSIREQLIKFFHPQRMAEWTGPSEFIQTRMDCFQHYDTLKDLDIAAHHFAMLWASVANTIPACFWCLYHLLSSPQAFSVVQEEIMGMFGENRPKSSLTYDKLTPELFEKLIYLESAINESLRLSSGSMNIRVVQENFCLHLNPHCSVGVRKGDIVALYPQSTHLDPDIYPNPKHYQFDRFVENGKLKTEFYKGSQKIRYYHMPFGSGATMCPGRFFAINELKQFLCISLLMYDMQLPTGQQQATTDKSRSGLGIIPPANHIYFRYRVKTNSMQRQGL